MKTKNLYYKVKPWFDECLSKLQQTKQSNENLAVFGWVVLNDKILSLKNAGALTEKQFNELHNKGVSVLQFDV